MKTIDFYLIHPYAYDANSALKYLQIDNIQGKYSFNWNKDTPQYLIASEQIYNNPKLNSVFLKLLEKAKILIFFTREAQTPDFNIFDYAIGFDLNLNFGDRFIQLPTAFDIYPDFINLIHNSFQLEDAKKEFVSKKGFCNFLYSNPKSHPIRDQLFYKLSEYKKVDSLGMHLNNVQRVGTGYKGHELDCIELKRPYKFSIASENAEFNGYTSEKILTSLCAHTVPIYFGDPSVGEIVNPKCFINVSKFKDLDELLEYVKMIDCDDSKYVSMLSEPWQTPEQELISRKRQADYIAFWDNIFAQDFDIARRKGRGCRPDIYQKFFESVKIKSKPKSLIVLYNYFRTHFR